MSESEVPKVNNLEVDYKELLDDALELYNEGDRRSAICMVLTAVISMFLVRSSRSDLPEVKLPIEPLWELLDALHDLEAGIVAPVLEPRRGGRPMLPARELRVRAFLIMAVQSAVKSNIESDSTSARRRVIREAKLLGIEITDGQLRGAKTLFRNAEKDESLDPKYISQIGNSLIIAQFHEGHWGDPQDPATFRFLLTQAAAAHEALTRQFGSNE